MYWASTYLVEVKGITVDRAAQFASLFYIAAIVVAHPYGGVKEQTAGLYAQTMSERGFVAVSYTHLDVYKRQADTCCRCVADKVSATWNTPT